MRKIKAGILCLAAVSLISLTPIRANAEWKSDNNGWWYSQGDSYATGWKQIDGNWYYFYSDGYMASVENIDGYFVNSSGVWTDSITNSEARQLILKADGNYISSKSECELSQYGEEYTIYNLPIADGAWGFEKEPFFLFHLSYVYDGQPMEDNCAYLVGKNSKRVYIVPNQGSMSMYEYKNNQKIRTYAYLGGKSHEWRS